MPVSIMKRDGRTVPFDAKHIHNAVVLAAKHYAPSEDAQAVADEITQKVLNKLDAIESTYVETVQDIVVQLLHEAGYITIANGYTKYRAERTRIREAKSTLMRSMTDLTFTKAVQHDDQRENANVDADAPMGTMLKYGTTASKEWCLSHVMSSRFADAHRTGAIHIHDLDFYALTTTCTQISLKKLFRGGFFTGHGYVREPNNIGSYAALACIAIQANQNDQHGGQSIPNFEYDLAPGVAKSYIKNLNRVMEANGYSEHVRTAIIDHYKQYAEEHDYQVLQLAEDHTLARVFLKIISADSTVTSELIEKTADHLEATAVKWTEKETYQAMEALIHNLNTMSSRAGAQVPFSSINYGTGTTLEQRMVIKQCLLALDAGLGHGETSIFPIHVFKTKKGVNFEIGDPNYDLFKLACKVSAKRLFPNFTFLDAPYNLEFYKKGDPDTEVATMGCRTRVMSNVNGPATTSGRGNLSFTTINLPRLGITANHDYNAFMNSLGNTAELVVAQLLERYEVQAKRHVYNYPFLMGQKVAMGSDDLSPNDEVREAIKHGTLTLGFIGLAEAMVALFGKHHGEDEEVAKKAYAAVQLIRKIADDATKKYHLNFSVIATPAEGLSGRFVRIDKKLFGVIKGVTDRDYYTNSFHLPVYFPTTVCHKIDVEAPYHTLCNGGHITYVELDGDITKNVDAFISVIKYMGEKGVGYGSINHPVDRCPICGFTGVINDECPRCGVHEGQEITVSEAKQIYAKFNK